MTEDPKSAIIRTRNLEAYYGANYVLKGINLLVRRGEILSIVGPSGGGKTTLLECISGTVKDKEAILKGDIVINGQDSTSIEPQKRNIGMVFQDLALFYHLTVEENIAFPLKIRKLSKKLIREKVNSILELIKLTEKRNSKINNLSGGEKQRVALARVLVYEPLIILMDEPLKALDQNLKLSFINDLLNIHKRIKFTLIFVTHDQSEALVLSDRIAILDNGKIIQANTPEIIYKNPDNIFTANFFGESNWKKVTINKESNSWNFNQIGNILTIPDIPEYDNLKVQDENLLWIRPENITIKKDSEQKVDTNSQLILIGKVIDSWFFGNIYKIKVEVAEDESLLVNSKESYSIGEKVLLVLDHKEIKLFTSK
ncbi:MAG: ABC transporter ATP-binding protein [Melioribacter sp.]|nr:ABC transporter ATP-binding protein [Melioribacter sp.]